MKKDKYDDNDITFPVSSLIFAVLGKIILFDYMIFVKYGVNYSKSGMISGRYGRRIIST